MPSIFLAMMMGASTLLCQLWKLKLMVALAAVICVPKLRNGVLTTIVTGVLTLWAGGRSCNRRVQGKPLPCDIPLSELLRDAPEAVLAWLRDTFLTKIVAGALTLWTGGRSCRRRMQGKSLPSEKPLLAGPRAALSSALAWLRDTVLTKIVAEVLFLWASARSCSRRRQGKAEPSNQPFLAEILAKIVAEVLFWWASLRSCSRRMQGKSKPSNSTCIPASQLLLAGPKAAAAA